MWPTAETMTAITNPWASATSSVPALASGPTAMIAPAPTKTSANVPTNSANDRRPVSASGGSGPMAGLAGSRIAKREPIQISGVRSRSSVVQFAEKPRKGSAQRHAARDRSGDVLHHRCAAVLEDEVELAEARDAIARPLRDVSAAPAVDTCAGQPRD